MTEVEPTWVHKRCVTAHCMVGNDALPPSRNAYELEDEVPYYQHQEKQKVLLTTINIVDDTMTEDNPDVERRVGARENRDQRHLLLLLGPLEAPDLPRRPEEERAEVLGEEDRESAPWWRGLPPSTRGARSCWRWPRSGSRGSWTPHSLELPA